MYHLTFLIAVGPCLIMALAALAMVTLSGTLARTRHARLWAVSFAIYAVEWGLVASYSADNTVPSRVPGFASVVATGAVFCYFAGFQQRYRTSNAAWLPATALGIVGLQLLLVLLVDRTSDFQFAGQIFFLTIRAFLFLLAAFLVTPDRRSTSATERSIVLMLLALAVTHFTLIAIAWLQHDGRLPNSAAIQYCSTMGTPVAAAMGLFTMLLIASDFSRARLRLIHTDPLTGVLNRLGFETSARSMMAKAKPPNRPVFLIVTDIDRFKTINDRFGHPTGDAALTSFATHLTEGLPTSAVVGRFGGEEFTVLLDGQTAASAMTRIEAIRASLPHMIVPGRSEVTLTASFGVAEQMPREPLADLYARADAALYRSKQGGRNRTTLADTL